MLENLKIFYNNPTNAEWMVALGTILLAIVTFVIHLMGDSYTRLIKHKYDYDFRKKAYDFLSVSLASWGNQAEVPTSPGITVEENIDKFYVSILDNQIFLSHSNLKQLNKYIHLAEEAAKAWDAFPKKHDERLKCMRKIANAMKHLSKFVGKEKEIKNMSKQYPDFF